MHRLCAFRRNVALRPAVQLDYSEIFQPDGPLSRAIPGYAFRHGQAEMADAVGTAVARGEPLMVEAGTGIGKTFAYLVPVLLPSGAPSSLRC